MNVSSHDQIQRSQEWAKRAKDVIRGVYWIIGANIAFAVYKIIFESKLVKDITYMDLGLQC